MIDAETRTADNFLGRWARFAARNRGKVVLGWIAGLVLVVVLSRLVGANFSNSFSVPGTESQTAQDLLQSRFPQQAGDTDTLVFQAAAGLKDPAVQSRIATILADAKSLPGVIAVGSPFQPGQGALSADGSIGYANLQYSERVDALPKDDATALLKLVDGAKSNGLTVEVGGQLVQNGEQTPPGSSELIGVLFAVVVLLIAFGSVVAMGLPLITALIGLGGSFMLLALAANFLSLPNFTTEFAALIGLGVGIDYALLVVTRYREGLHGGLSVEDAIVRAISTAGRSVLFAGTVVCIALLGLLSVGIPFVGALGEGAAMVVAVAVLVALALLPALLAYAGRRIDSLRIPFIDGSTSTDRGSFWYRFASMTQRRPLLWFTGSLVLLVALALPFFSMRLGSSDAGNGPTSLHSRRAYDLLSQGFGPGFNGPLTIAVDLQGAGGAAQSNLATLHDALAKTAGVAQVSPPITNPTGDAAIVQVSPTTSPQDTATETLIRTLRKNVIPQALAGTGVHAYVTGPTAAFGDISDRITGRLPLFFGAVIGLSCLILMAVFRSVVVAVKAAIMNLLSIGAAYGVLVAVFQWGWFSNIVGVKQGPIESFLPMMLFAILFGLSMHYEVFLISRVREEYLRTGRNSDSVAHGLAVTARVITAAAAIMIFIFLSFVLGNARIIKEFGLGLAVAILVDATVVRLVLVPATMELLGDANWWLPRWLDRLLPRLDLEGEEMQPALDAAAAD
jgi:putative drug exporter of the RND superfamily